MWVIDKEKRGFVHGQTSEVRAELYVQIAEAHANRVLHREGKRVCYSDDAKVSYAGMDCMSCPHISEIDAFDKYYEAHPDQHRPCHVGDCSLRYTVAWKREFTHADGGWVHVEYAAPATLSCPKSSIRAIFGNGGYLPKLAKMGLDITKVVTKIKMAQGMNEATKATYDYVDFEVAAHIKEAMAQAKRTVPASLDRDSK